MAEKELNRVIILSPNRINSEEILRQQVKEAQIHGCRIIINIEKAENLLVEDLTKEISLSNLSIENNLEDEKIFLNEKISWRKEQRLQKTRFGR